MPTSFKLARDRLVTKQRRSSLDGCAVQRITEVICFFVSHLFSGPLLITKPTQTGDGALGCMSPITQRPEEYFAGPGTKRRRIGSFATQEAGRCACVDLSRLGGVHYSCRRVSPGRKSVHVSTDTNRVASKIQGLDHLRSADPLLGRKGVAARGFFSAHRHSVRTQNSTLG